MNICFIALKRSGHHAIINWFLRGNPDNCLFINNITEIRPWGPQPPLQPKVPLRELIDQAKNKLLNNCLVPVARPNEEIKHIVYNIEDANIATFRDDYKHLLAGVMPDRVVLCLRDPFNNIASRIQFNKNLPKPVFKIKEILPIWKIQAQQFVESIDTNLVKINYNKWCRSKEYRDLIAQQLKIENNDEALFEVHPRKVGSSFDLMNFEAQGYNMDVLNRYSNFQHDPDYRKLFDKETRVLAKEIFDLDLEIKIL